MTRQISAMGNEIILPLIAGCTGLFVLHFYLVSLVADFNNDYKIHEPEFVAPFDPQYETAKPPCHRITNITTYGEILREWFNFSAGYNKVNSNDTPADDPTLISLIRNKYLIREHKSSIGYSRLKAVADPSMGQAIRILNYFHHKRKGFFIECGAYDGESRSNTLYLERYLGWTGLLIEPNPINFVKVLHVNRRAVLSPACLSPIPHPTMVSFAMYGNVGKISPLNPGDVKPYHKDTQCFPLMSYLYALNRTYIDYLSLDIEGQEVDVLETIPFDKVVIQTLSVEVTHSSRSEQYLMEMMDERGYYFEGYVNHPRLANDMIFIRTTRQTNIPTTEPDYGLISDSI